MILSRNIDPRAVFAQQPVSIVCNEGASVAGVVVGSLILPFKGKVVSAKFYCAALTDADDSVTIDLLKNGSTVLAAPVDPVAADTTTALAPTAAGSLFNADDRYSLKVTTGVGDAIRGTLVLVVRPLLGGQELADNASLI